MIKKNLRLLKLRKEYELTQEELGQAVGLSQSMIAHLEAGTKDTTRKYKLRLAKFFQVSVEWLFYEQLEEDKEMNVKGGDTYVLSK